MTALHQNLLKRAYDAFNARNIDAVLLLMHRDVHWPNGWEGGYVDGHDEVRDYWTRQWREIDPHVESISFKEREDGRIEVEVHQLVKDLQGKRHEHYRRLNSFILLPGNHTEVQIIFV
jgi:nuclear transport factor 2 (NTF2) superfamily protein